MNTPTVKIPLALQHLIEMTNKAIQEYQRELTEMVTAANEDTMKQLGLDPAEGWRLDLSTLAYVKVSQPDAPVTE